MSTLQAALPADAAAASAVDTRRPGDVETGSLGAKQAQPSRASNCLGFMKRQWRLLVPTTTGIPGVAAVATATTTAGWVAGAVIVGFSIIGGIVLAATAPKEELTQTVDRVGMLAEQQASVSKELIGTAVRVHGIAVMIHADATTLEQLQQKAQDLELRESALSDQLASTTAKLEELKPLEERLRGVLTGISEQAAALGDAHAAQAATASRLADGVSGLREDAADLTVIRAGLSQAKHAIAQQGTQLDAHIASFGTMVQRLLSAHEQLQIQSRELQREIREAGEVRQVNHELAAKALALEAHVRQLSAQMEVFSRVDISAVSALLPRLQQHMPEIMQILGADMADGAASPFSALSSRAPSTLPR